MTPDEVRALEERVVATAALVHAATAELSTMLAELHAAGGCVGGGIRSVAHWANIHLGIGSAQRLVTLAAQVEQLPAIAAGWRSGALSTDKVAALAPVTTPAFDEKLARIGQDASLAQLQRICSELRRVDEDEEEAAEQRKALRAVESSRHASGLQKIVALLEPEEAALVLKALDARVEDRWRAEQGAGVPCDVRPTRFGQRRADALVEIAAEGLESGPRPVVRGEATEVVVHVDLEVLLGGEGGRAWIDGVGSVPRSTVEQLLCDCDWRATYEDANRHPLDLGRRRRTVSKKQRRALRARDRGCRFPGCTNRTFVDAHHVVPWELFGTTDMDNLVLLCPAHHRLFHEGSYRIASHGCGRFTFLRPDGRPIEARRRRPPRPTGTCPTGSPRATDGGARFDMDTLLDHLLAAS